MSVGMLVIAGLWGLIFLVFTGVGVGLLRGIGSRRFDAQEVFLGFWLGYAAAISFLQLWHLVAPISPVCFQVLGAGALIGWASRGVHVGEWWRVNRHRSLDRLPRLALLALAWSLFAVWLSNRALAPITPQDAGIYHLGSIRWAQQFAIVPGLANLHGRFGFNSSHLLVLAMLDLGSWAPSFHHLTSGLLLLVSSTHAWWLLGQLIQRQALAGAETLIGALPLAGLAPYYFLEASATSTDLPALLLGLTLGVSFFRVLFPREPDRVPIDVFAVVVLAAAGVSVKLSFVLLGLPVATVAAVVAAHRPGAKMSGARSVLMVAAVMAAVTLGTWATRGVIPRDTWPTQRRPP